MLTEAAMLQMMCKYARISFQGECEFGSWRRFETQAGGRSWWS